VEKVPGVTGVTVEVVWDPPWTPEKMSADAKQQLQSLQNESSQAQQDFDPSVFKPIKKGHIVKNPDGSIILISPTNTRFRVNEDIANLWEKAEGTRSVDEITSLAAMDLQLSPVELRPQIIELYRSLIAGGLVEPEKREEHVLPLRS
ncbi:MAG TPA: hypothetical protein VE177_03120, partial [Candidatus Binatus sp.]|nr:hypothetical protein [Candidatus Binatus sp.]